MNFKRSNSKSNSAHRGFKKQQQVQIESEKTAHREYWGIERMFVLNESKI